MNGHQQQLRVLVWVLGAVVAMALIMSALAWSSGGTSSGWGGMMAFGWLWMLAPIALMVAIMYGMMSMGHGGDSHAESAKDDEDARAVLDRRYAAGGLSREEYLRMKEDLGRGR